jgi:methyl-accepting chemotaxis protein
MTLGKRVITLAIVTTGATLVTAAVAGSEWRWVVAGAGSLATAALAFWILRMVNLTLRHCVEELAQGTGEVASAAGQVSSSSQNLAQGASEQAATLQQTSASSEELSSMTQKNADSARSAAELMLESERLVGSANQTLVEMVTSMSEINSASDKIARIIKVIDEIAFQTNILALNAAVEAARAGEAGMGFAVVADEVRNLAQRSAQAAKDTAGIIEESINKSNEGSKKLDQVKDAMSAITASGGKVKTLVDEVSVGSQEQAQGFAEITGAISQMEQVTQQTAAGAQESASASQELTSQASVMKESIGQLTELLEGVTGHEPLHQRPIRELKPLSPRDRASSVTPAMKIDPPAANPEEEFPLEDSFR